MKIVFLISRILLGLVFTVFGANGFFHFLPNPPLPPGPAGQFLGAMFESHYLVAVAGVQLIGGILLLVNRYVPFALTILGAEVVNILLYHVLMAPQGIGVALFTTLLWFVTFWSVRSAFAGIFQAKVQN